MLSLREVDEAIAVYEKEPATMALVARLADLYTVRNHLVGVQGERRSEAPETSPERLSIKEIPLNSDSEFAKAIQGKDVAAVWAAVDELVETIKIVNPRLYDGLLRQLRKVKNSSE